MVCYVGVCGDACADPESEACESCLDNQCYPALGVCTGFAGPEPEVDACLGEDDLAALAEQDFDLNDEFVLCVQACAEDVQFTACVSQCYAEEVGLSLACADCWAIEATCVLTECYAPCFGDGDPDECAPCVTAACLPAFYECTGFDSPEGG